MDATLLPDIDQKLGTIQKSDQGSEPLMEKVIEKVTEYDRHERKDESRDATNISKDGRHGLHFNLKEDEENLKQYIKEDKQLEEEGQTYGGLM